jgi:broad specificity phosphatase PhoE
MSRGAALRVHWMRHGKVASHQGDMPLTEEGRRQAESAGQRLGQILLPGEIVALLHAPTLRTRETATLLYNSMQHALDERGEQGIDLLAPRENQALRNPDLYVAGTRVEMGSSPAALAAQLSHTGLDEHAVARLSFWPDFWAAEDRIGFWVNHSNPPGEDADTVARRMLTFAVSLLDLPGEQSRRFICVTHSPLLRAFARRYLPGSDPGEPEYTASLDLEFTVNSDFTIRYLNVYKKIMPGEGA